MMPGRSFWFDQAHIFGFLEQPPFLASNKAWKTLVFLLKNKSKLLAIFFLAGFCESDIVQQWLKAGRLT